MQSNNSSIENKDVVLKAPTGSGKTFIASSLFEELVEENEDLNFCIIWACPGKGELHKQSYDAVKTYVEGNPVCSLLEEDFFGSRQFIKKHEVVFVNWEKLVDKDKETGKWLNNLMKDQEGNNFINVIDNTKRNNTKIVLVIDESHIGASSQTRIQEFKNSIIIPDVVLEMSATPLNRADVVIDAEDVIKEGMIKNNIIVNEGIDINESDLESKDSETIILEKGYKKRMELLEAFKKHNSNVNPLVLIQIPNKEAGDEKIIAIKDFLRDKDITEENGKLKIWLSDRSGFDKKVIKSNDDITEFLIFKTAVATGWDCPRAHVLIKFREGKSEIFEIQTIGRILRTPEAKAYDDELLDNAYVYTNSIKFETKQDSYNPNKIKTEVSKMNERYTPDRIYEQTQLESFYRSRQGDYNSAASNFTSYFRNEFMKYFDLKEDDKYMYDICEKKLEKKIKLDTKTIDKIISEKILKTKNIDEAKLYNTDSVNVIMAEHDIKAQYYDLIRDNLNGLAYVRSKSPINTAIIDAFSTFYDIFERSNKITSIQKIVVVNKDDFALIINESTKKYRLDLQNKNGRTGVDYKFTFLENRYYSKDNHRLLPTARSLYLPLYVLQREDGSINGLEADFLAYLDVQNCVEWYFENGAELVQTNFGISYNNRMNTFQPDFIVKFKNGDVGIFDTKPVQERVEDTKIKAEALYEYCNRMNKRKNVPKVIGGIVVKKRNSFYYYNDEIYHDIDETVDGWKPFENLIDQIENDIHNKEYLRKNK